MSHDVVRSTLGEQLDKLIEYGKAQGTFALTLVLDEAGDYSAVSNFGYDADGECRAGSRVVYGGNAVEVLGKLVAECGLPSSYGGERAVSSPRWS